jgi:xanthine dehydrogenase YagS FAD-binding subunit
MEAFRFTRAADVSQAIHLGQGQGTRFIAGGTNLLDLMKLDVERPNRLVDINRLPLSMIEKTPDGGLKIGTLVRNSDLAYAPEVQELYPVLSQALLSGASAQLRNMATTGGNLLQRTRCLYFRNDAMPCNKREPGSGCAAIGGENRTLAILGTSKDCIATNPSDMNVALTALEAVIHIEGVKRERTVPIADFFLVPGDTPRRENALEPGDLITHITLPPARKSSKQVYLKLRDRASYEFALASAAIVVELSGDRISYARVVMGGVGTKPWRALEAEKVLHGQKPDAATFERASHAALHGAQPQSQNGFKVELARRCVAHALSLATQQV